ncbi:OsmC-like protein [Crateriforma conspicua]|uniref:OsmC-like protein n=1 Tax=Crateriforma conspicua TaxID=2527996 RepID=A0A5C6FKU6_9PLAN|nr:OsmC family protein [Crateriforma conspicua]TWU62627.1 OsmC-like protein [Crateriforma conspicua]
MNNQPIAESSPIVRKVAPPTSREDAGVSLQPVQKREVVLSVQAESLDNTRKRATVRSEQPNGSTFEIICDEGDYLGGDDTAPPPLAYFSASLAFCLLTQLSRYAAIKKLKIDLIQLSQETRFSMEGSALKGTLAGNGVKVVTQVDIESNEPEDVIRTMVEVGENSCFAMQSVVHPVPTEMRVNLNGSPLDIDC